MMHNPSATRKMKNANDALMHCCGFTPLSHCLSAHYYYLTYFKGVGRTS